MRSVVQSLRYDAYDVAGKTLEAYVDQRICKALAKHQDKPAEVKDSGSVKKVKAPVDGEDGWVDAPNGDGYYYRRWVGSGGDVAWDVVRLCEGRVMVCGTSTHFRPEEFYCKWYGPFDLSNLDHPATPESTKLALLERVWVKEPNQDGFYFRRWGNTCSKSDPLCWDVVHIRRNGGTNVCEAMALINGCGYYSFSRFRPDTEYSGPISDPTKEPTLLEQAVQNVVHVTTDSQGGLNKNLEWSNDTTLLDGHCYYMKHPHDGATCVVTVTVKDGVVHYTYVGSSGPYQASPTHLWAGPLPPPPGATIPVATKPVAATVPAPVQPKPVALQWSEGIPIKEGWYYMGFGTQYKWWRHPKLVCLTQTSGHMYYYDGYGDNGYRCDMVRGVYWAGPVLEPPQPPQQTPAAPNREPAKLIVEAPKEESPKVAAPELKWSDEVPTVSGCYRMRYRGSSDKEYLVEIATDKAIDGVSFRMEDSPHWHSAHAHKGYGAEWFGPLSAGDSYTEAGDAATT